MAKQYRDTFRDPKDYDKVHVDHIRADSWLCGKFGEAEFMDGYIYVSKHTLDELEIKENGR